MPSPSKSNIYFFYENPISLRGRTALKDFVSHIIKREKRKVESLNYIFCSDQRLLQINKQYLNHDFYTDIITFELSSPNKPIEGEIYISIDRVKENSRSLKEPLSRELLRVIFHGALHLCGYQDKTVKEKAIMRKKEDFYLNKYLIRST